MCSLLSSVLYGTGLLRGMVNLTWGAALKGKYDLIASTMAIEAFGEPLVSGPSSVAQPVIPNDTLCFPGE